MPLDGPQAMQVWNLARRVQNGGCVVPSGSIHLRTNLAENRLYVGIYITQFVARDGEVLDVNSHITVLTVNSFASTNLGISPELIVRTEHDLAIALRNEPIRIAGDLEPLYVNDEPHRVIMTVHVQSNLHARLYSVRNRLLQSYVRGRGRVDHRVNFHISIDRPGPRPWDQEPRTRNPTARSLPC